MHSASEDAATTVFPLVVHWSFAQVLPVESVHEFGVAAAQVWPAFSQSPWFCSEAALPSPCASCRCRGVLAPPVAATVHTRSSAPVPTLHSSIRLLQFVPPQPDAQPQVYSSIACVQALLFSHGPDWHSSRSSWHSTAVAGQAGARVRINSFEHAAPFWHGVEAHSLLLVAQLSLL